MMVDVGAYLVARLALAALLAGAIVAGGRRITADFASGYSRRCGVVRRPALPSSTSAGGGTATNSGPGCAATIRPRSDVRTFGFRC
jgi:hypothetical protein